MGEYILKYELDPELEKLLREIYTRVTDPAKYRQSRLSDFVINSKNLRKETGWSAKTEYNLRQRGELIGKKIGSTWFYPIAQFIKQSGDSDNSTNSQD